MTAANKGTSAGGRHGSRSTDKTDRNSNPESTSGLQEHTGEFRIGEKIIFGMRNGNVLIRHSPQGEEVEVSEAVLSGLMVDAFFTDKFGSEYQTVEKSG